VGYLRWLTRAAWGFWAAFAPTVASVALGCVLPTGRNAATVLAGVLQLAGLAIAFAGLLGDARAFGRSLAAPFGAWWASRPGIGRLNVGLASSVETAGRVGFKVTRAVPPGGTVDERLAWLEKRIVLVQTQADDLASGLQEVRDNAAEGLSAAVQQVTAEVTATNERVRDHAVGSLHASALGFYFVLIGTLLGVAIDLRAP
jgi:hypothetical protein